MHLQVKSPAYIRYVLGKADSQLILNVLRDLQMMVDIMLEGWKVKQSHF